MVGTSFGFYDVTVKVDLMGQLCKLSFIAYSILFYSFVYLSTVIHLLTNPLGLKILGVALNLGRLKCFPFFSFKNFSF